MSKLVATVYISHPMRSSDMGEKIKNFISEHYPEAEDTGVTVGGGYVDLAFVFPSAVSSKEEFETKIKPFKEKFELLKPFVEYESEKDFLDQKEYQKQTRKKQEALKTDLAGIYVALRDKYKNDPDSLRDIDHIFCYNLPPMWQVEKKN